MRSSSTHRRGAIQSIFLIFATGFHSNIDARAASLPCRLRRIASIISRPCRHAQRFAQLAKHDDVIQQIFADPHTAGTTERERAIVRYAIDITLAPESIDANALAPLIAAGLSTGEILDLSYAVAMFAWANRLMLMLGEPSFPS